MGRASGFRNALARRPLEGIEPPPWPGAGGSHEGLAGGNEPPEVRIACADEAGFDYAIWRDLHDRIDLGGLYDIIDHRVMRDTEARASYWNREEQRETS